MLETETLDQVKFDINYYLCEYLHYNYKYRRMDFFNLRYMSFVKFCAIFFILLLGINNHSFAQEIRIPEYWDPSESFVKPAKNDVTEIRFITSTDFPPFSYIDDQKQIAGFNIDLARAICAQLEIPNSCNIRALPWNEQEAALNDGKADVLISGIAINSGSRSRLDFSRPYLVVPARFLALRQNRFDEPLYRTLAAKIVGVVYGSSHAAYLVANFGRLNLRIFLDRNSAFEALISNEIDAVFSDGLSLASWLHSEQSKDCCRFVGGPYLSAKYFGQGLAIAVAKDNHRLLAAINYALRAINDKGEFAELYLRYFPESLY